MTRRFVLSIVVCAGVALGACATHGPEASASRRGEPLRLEAARTAVSMIGVPYRYAGSSPRGFDCSGLVTYSYSKAGLSGLPHSAEALHRKAQRVPLAQLEPERRLPGCGRTVRERLAELREAR